MPLPDCMMPDGAEPCLGYRETRTELELERKENERLRTALSTIINYSENWSDARGSICADVARKALNDV